MSVSTNVYLVKQHEVEQFQLEVVKALRKGFGKLFLEDSVNVRDCRTGYHKDNEQIFLVIDFVLDYKNSDFSNNKECRSINIFHNPKEKMKRDFYNLHYNLWGHSKEVANCLVDYFGGLADYSDCDDVEIDYCKSQVDSFLGIKA
jgi:hypothetical protein